MGKNSLEKNVFAKDIEAKFDLRRASTTGMLQNMEKRGLIKRETIDSDGRCRRIILTRKAIELRKKLENEIQKVEEKATKGISKQEIEQFIQIAEKMSSNLEKNKK